LPIFSSATQALIQLRKRVFLRKTTDALNVDNASGKDVKFRGGKFKETEDEYGGSTDLTWTGSLEYWIMVVVHGMGQLEILELGDAVHDPKQGGMLPHNKLIGTLWVAFTMLPILDSWLPDDWSNPRKDDPGQKHKAHDLKFRGPLYAWTFIELWGTVAGIMAAVKPSLNMTTLDRYSLMAMIGIANGGFGITISHELLHKPSLFEKICGHSLMLNVNYMHWGDEHLNGHHTHVSTPGDPASSHKGQSLYSFLPQTFIGTYKSAWGLEMERLSTNGYDVETYKWSPFHNRMIMQAAAPLAWAGAIAKFTGGGWEAIKLFYFQGIVAATLLEIINYVEHYGLSRDRLPDGNYEPVNPTHSWNAPQKISNTVLFKLQRHSDHHTFASRPYHLLRNFKESPQMPTGYPGMVVLAMFPPAFFWIVDPMVEAVKARGLKSAGGNGEKQFLEANEEGKRKASVFFTALFLGATAWLQIRAQK
jgi:alkane 1-monooxygenase